MPTDQTPRQRLVQWTDPSELLGLLKGLSGLEALRAIINGTVPPPPFAMLLGARLVEVGEGRAVFEAVPGEEHYNPQGVVHGGFALSLLDSALGCAVASMLPVGSTYGSIDVHARLLRPITKETGNVRCEAQLVSLTRSLATSEGRITDASGRVLATGTTACMIRSSALPNDKNR